MCWNDWTQSEDRSLLIEKVPTLRTRGMNLTIDGMNRALSAQSLATRRSRKWVVSVTDPSSMKLKRKDQLEISCHCSTIRWSAEFVANTTDTSILFRRRDTLRAMSSIIQIIWRYESTKRWDSQDDATKSVHILKSKSSIQRMIQIWCRDYDESYRTLSSYDSYYNDKINTHTISRRERDVTT